LITEEGETNAIRHMIDARQAAIRKELANRPEHRDNSMIQEAARTSWSKDTLEPTIRSFKAGLIHSIHERREEMPEDIRPGEELKELTESLHRQMPLGRPDIPIAAAFMPAHSSEARRS
jgi:hypothetical protein